MYTIEDMNKTYDWDDEKGQTTNYHFTFGFKTKEQYLEETDGWKAEYKELSKRIRQHKVYRKPSKRPADMADWQNLNTLHSLQEQARLMNAMRVQAKAEAGRRMVRQQQAA